MENILELKNIKKSFGGTSVLNGIDLCVQPGEFITLLGSSGCGKTTTLRIISGLETPDSGSVLLEGVDVTNTEPNRRNVHTVFQNYALFPHMNVEANIGYSLKLRGVKKPEIKERVREMLELVQLTEYGDRMPGELSGGQRQRVAIARSVIDSPKVLLLDEPLGALDLKLREQMQLELKKLQQSLGITFIFVTHDQGEALSMSDRVAVFNNGRIEQVDSPRDLYMRPRTPFVAGFVGTSNVFDGLMAEKLCGMTGSFALRPEHIRLNTPGELQANGTIQAVQYQGAATRFELKLNGGEKLLVSQANMTGEELPATLTPGQQVMVSWSRDVMVPLVEER